MSDIVTQPTAVVIPPLSEQEAADFKSLERKMGDGVSRFKAGIMALLEIRDRKLYRQDYPNFEAYCRVRWGFNRSQAYRWIDAAQVVKMLSPSGDSEKGDPAPDLIKSEGQIRELGRLKDDPAKMRAAWESAVASTNGVPTGKDVSVAVDKILYGEGERVVTRESAGPRSNGGRTKADLEAEFEEEMEALQIWVTDPAHMAYLPRFLKFFQTHVEKQRS